MRFQSFRRKTKYLLTAGFTKSRRQIKVFEFGVVDDNRMRIRKQIRYNYADTFTTCRRRSQYQVSLPIRCREIITVRIFSKDYRRITGYFLLNTAPILYCPAFRNFCPISIYPPVQARCTTCGVTRAGWQNEHYHVNLFDCRHAQQ